MSALSSTRALRHHLEKQGFDDVHFSVGCAPEGVTEDDDSSCCMGAATRGPHHCTCWVPVYDLEQAEELDVAAPTPTAAKCCVDCAYRPGSPERSDEFEEEMLLDLPSGPSVFACHQGMRRAVTYRHPDGRELPAGEGDYMPPIVAGRAYRADGSPADLCAGWAARR